MKKQKKNNAPQEIEKQIAVITQSESDFKRWVDEFGNEKRLKGAKLVMVSKIEDAIGREFIRVEFGYNFSKISFDVISFTMDRLRLEDSSSI